MAGHALFQKREGIENFQPFTAGALQLICGLYQPNIIDMSHTETLLLQAQEIARRAFENPSDEAVMKLFERLSYEADLASEKALGASLH
jgi:hypothetical protein